MRKASQQLGRKWSEPRKQRHRDNMARLKAEGRKFGAPCDPRTRIEKRICQLPTCGIEFPFRVRPKTPPDAGRYCKQRHATQHVAILRMKVPDDYDLLYDLYVVKDMTTPEIAEIFHTQHHAVLSRLRYLGIERRKVGASRHFVCTIEGCNKPVFKIKHPQNGSMYGTKCEAHYWEHRKQLYVNSYERKKAARGNIPEKVYREMSNGATTSQEVARRLTLPIKVVSTTMGHLHRRGEVEPVGSVMVNRASQILWRVVESKAEAVAC